MIFCNLCKCMVSYVLYIQVLRNSIIRIAMMADVFILLVGLSKSDRLKDRQRINTLSSFSLLSIFLPFTFLLFKSLFLLYLCFCCPYITLFALLGRKTPFTHSPNIHYKFHSIISIKQASKTQWLNEEIKKTHVLDNVKAATVKYFNLFFYSFVFVCLLFSFFVCGDVPYFAEL